MKAHTFPKATGCVAPKCVVCGITPIRFAATKLPCQEPEQLTLPLLPRVPLVQEQSAKVA